MKRLSDIRTLEQRIDKKVRALHAFAGVPPGTTGIVIGIYRKTKDLDGTFVRWDTPDRKEDAFSRQGLVDEGHMLEVIE